MRSVVGQNFNSAGRGCALQHFSVPVRFLLSLAHEWPDVARNAVARPSQRTRPRIARMPIKTASFFLELRGLDALTEDSSAWNSVFIFSSAWCPAGMRPGSFRNEWINSTQVKADFHLPRCSSATTLSFFCKLDTDQRNAAARDFAGRLGG